jgi:hypothetical protein
MPLKSFWSACAVIACVFAAGLAFYSTQALNPPRALPKDAPAEQFSAHRAIEHAFACSKESHPAGSKNDDRVAQYFMDTLKEMGVEAEFMSKPTVYGGTVQLQQAVIGRIPGTDNTGAIAFSAHYDSVPYGPGATDDISGCITMLEAARAFTKLPQMRNDLLFIFADAEEIGGYGAKGFCSHPLAEKIGVITELDVRGVAGPALIYEMSSGNGALIAELRKADGVLPLTSSLMYAVYKASPFGSDFGKFRDAGMKGYSLAYIDNFAWYHTANDSPEHISPNSIQHFGEFTMNISKHFGNADFGKVTLATKDDIFFNTLGFHLVQYPMSHATPFAVFAIAALLTVIVAGFAKKRIRVGGFVLALLLFPLTAALSAGIALAMLSAAFGYENVVHLYTVKVTYIPEPRAFYEGNLYCYAFGLMALAVAGLIYCAASRRLRAEELHAAALTWLCPVLVGTVLTFSGGSYLFMWPILFGALGLALICLGNRETGPGPLLLLVAVLFAVPALCLLPPGWRSLMWMVNLLGAPLLAVLAVVLLLNLMPALTLLGRVRHSWMVWIVAALVAGAMLGGGIMVNKPSKDRPVMNSVTYTANLDKNEAWWMSEDMKVDEWTRQFFPDGRRGEIDDIDPGTKGDHFLRATAPVAQNLTGVRIDTVKDEAVDGKRRLTLRLHTNDAPFRVHLRQTEGPAITAATVNGMTVPAGEQSLSINFDLFAKDGYELVLETTPGEALSFEANQEVYGFPNVPGITPRPDYMIPESNILRNGISLRGEHMYVKNSFQVAAGPAVITPAPETVAAPAPVEVSAPVATPDAVAVPAPVEAPTPVVAPDAAQAPPTTAAVPGQ